MAKATTVKTIGLVGKPPVFEHGRDLAGHCLQGHPPGPTGAQARARADVDPGVTEPLFPPGVLRPVSDLVDEDDKCTGRWDAVRMRAARQPPLRRGQGLWRARAGHA